jgi:hypothetical protein
MPCNECDETRYFLLRPEQEPPLIQLDPALRIPHRKAITPMVPPFEIRTLDLTTLDERQRASRSKGVLESDQGDRDRSG